MANSGVLRVSTTATLGSFQFQPSFWSSVPPIKVGFKHCTGEGCVNYGVMTKWSCKKGNNIKCHYQQSSGITENGEQFLEPASDQGKEGFLFNAINMSFSERLRLAWKILFPSATARRNSIARIAKQRLKMILFSDRCAVSDEAKQKIVGNVVNALSDFVEIDSHEKVQLGVSTDLDMGTLYSITVPVRRVKPEYQENEFEDITSIEPEDTRGSSDSVDYDSMSIENS